MSFAKTVLGDMPPSLNTTSDAVIFSAGDDYLSYKEYEKMMVEQLESHIVEQQFLEQCFAKMDVNRDGTITAKEIAKTMKISNAEADELVREGDTDGDGELTFEGTGTHLACNSLGIGN